MKALVTLIAITLFSTNAQAGKMIYHCSLESGLNTFSIEENVLPNGTLQWVGTLFDGTKKLASAELENNSTIPSPPFYDLFEGSNADTEFRLAIYTQEVQPNKLYSELAYLDKASSLSLTFIMTCEDLDP